jgi:ATP-dependent Clp protease ATP-binding subunit ClpC
MLERFTERARRVVVLASEEARNRRHAAVGPEHLLIGILRDGGGLAVCVMERLRLSSDIVRAELERVLNDAPTSMTGGDTAFSSELKAVLEAALEEQRRHRHGYVGTEHLLLGLLADEGSEASRILRDAGADLTEARRTTLLYLGDTRIPFTEENVRFIATSTWRVRI